MELIRIDRDRAEAGALASRPRDPLVTQDPTAGTPTDSDFGAAAKAAFMRETTLGNLIDLATREAFPEGSDPDYNPWTYIKSFQPGDKAEAERLAQRYGDIFANAKSADQVDWIMKRAKDEEAREKEMGRSIIGMFAGAMLDPINFVPFVGAPATLGRASRAGFYAAQLAGQTALTETLAHFNQSTRTSNETIAAVAISAAFGGVLGAATSRMVPKVIEDLRKPADLIAERADGTFESVGAAASPLRRGIAEDLANTGDTANVGGNAFTEFFARRTPLGRAVHANSPVARTIMLRMVDMGGRLTKGSLDGVGIAVGGSAEDLKLMMQGWSTSVFLDGEKILQGLQKNLGDLGQKKIDNDTFHAATQRTLLGVFDDNDRATLKGLYGDQGAAQVESSAMQWAESIHSLNDRFEAKLTEFGIVRDVAAHKKWIGDVGKADATLAKLAERRKELVAKKAEAAKAAKSAEDATSSIDADAAIAKQIEELDAEAAKAQRDRQFAAARRDEESAKPEPLGRNYGHAQLWNAAEIRARREEFREFLTRLLVTEPDADWLAREHNLAWEGLQDLKVTDTPRYMEIMKQWSGDERYFKIHILENKLDAANERVASLETDLKSLLVDMGENERALSAATTAEAKALAKQKAADLAAREQAIATEKAQLRLIIAGEEVIERQRVLDEAVPAAPRPSAEATRGPVEDVAAELAAFERNAATVYPELSAQRKAAQGSLRTSESELTALQSALQGVEKEGRAAEGRLSALQRTLEDATRDLENLQAARAAELEDPDVAQNIADLQAQIELSTKERPVLEARLKDQVKAVLKARKAVEDASGAVTQRKKELASSATALTELSSKLQALRAKAKAPKPEAAPVDARKAPTARGVDVPKERRIAKAKERMAQLEREESRLASAREKIENLQRKADEASFAKYEKKQTKALLSDLVDNIGGELKLAERSRGAVKRALTREGKRGVMYDVIDEIIGNLADGKTPPMMDRIVPETSARMKARRITLDAAAKNEALASRWLRTDLPNILGLQYDQLSGHLGMREAFDMKKGGTFESIEQIRAKIAEDYDARAGAAKTPKDSANLRQEKRQMLADFDAMYRRLVGATDPGIDRDGVGYWLSRKARDMTYLKYGAGFGLASLPDIASYALYNRGMMKALFTQAPEFWRIIRGVSKSELESMVVTTELGARAALTIHHTGGLDDFAVRGVGEVGTTMHSVTSAVDKGTRKLTEWTQTISGLPMWTRFLKMTAGLQTAQRVRDMVGNYGSLNKAMRAELASLGIGEREAEALADQFKRFATKDDNGRPLFNLEDWDNQRARKIFEIAVNRNMNRASITPGIADRPVVMDKWWGALYFQLQTFAFAFMNRYMAPASQRALHAGDYGNVTASLGILVASTALTMGIRDAMNGKDPAKRYEGVSEDPAKAFKFTRELVDRSGLMTYMAPYASAFSKLTGIDDGGSRFARMNWSEPLLGVQASNFGDLTRVGSAIASGDEQKSAEAIARILPFSTFLRAVVNNVKD
jgi:hypothetical protein